MAREKFATQVDKEILMAIRALAHEEGRRIEQLIDEALSELIEKRRKARARAHVMAAYRTSHDKFGDLYKKLAE